jgi:hypothetical protein
MSITGRIQFAAQVLLTLMSLALGTIAIAGPIISNTDSFGVIYTLSSDNINHGTAANPTYDLFITANTSGFSTLHNGVNYTYANAYINDISVLANATPNNLSRTLGPGNFTDFSLWTNVPGGQNSNQCDGSGMHFDCAFFSTGGNPTTGPGVLMSSTMTNPANPTAGILEWEFILHFAAGTVDPLSFAPGGSHLKVDYFGFANGGTTGAYNFIGQISDNVTINGPPSTSVPEPGSLALLGALALGFGVTKKLRQAVREG